MVPAALMRRWLSVVFGSLLVVAVLGCGQQAPSTAAAPPPTPVGGSAATPTERAPTAAAPGAAPAPQRLRVAYSALWALNAVPWAALEEGIFARHGLDVEMRFIASAQTVPAALSGDVDLSFGGGYAAVTSRLGGSDALIVFNLANWSPYELMVTPDINSAADLRGKALGVSRFGSASDTATRDALRRLGLVPERDVTLLQLQSLTERIAAMHTGQIAGGVALAPDNVLLRRQGFKTLIDLGATGEPELTNTAFSTQRWLDAHEATAQAFVDALVEGIHFVKTNREATLRVLAKYLELDDPEALEAAYDAAVGQRLEPLPDLGIEAARRYLRELSASDPRAVGARAEDFFATRFVDSVRARGLVDRLYRGQ
ncbi:MAG TPA: ABC transporter substrate-binding protein [Chloroflexota bacterium]|nr:ABC transporter substrate-binding protein [Chloroflexota bacterium]